MIDGKTFYQILGLLPDAEDIVIKAAYRSLSQKYHPDKWQGDSDFAQKRMSEINRAYEVLSDQKRRKDYDETLREEGVRDDFVEEEDAETFDEFLNETEESWKLAREYFPEIEIHFQRLRSLNKGLALQFRQVILAKKLFSNSDTIYSALKKSYLSTWFGDDERIQGYAEELIMERRREAALELNKVINILGASAPVDRVIQEIEKKYPSRKKPESGMAALLERKKQRLLRCRDKGSADDLINYLGGKVEATDSGRGRKIWIMGKVYDFDSITKYVDFVVAEYCFT